MRSSARSAISCRHSPTGRRRRCKANTKGGSGILNGRMGWDITDYGQGKFDELGLFLFTVRNGVAADLARGRGMVYAEKIMISKKNQMSPMHRHDIKSEDIINRGGGKLVLELFMAKPDGSIDEEAEVRVDLRWHDADDESRRAVEA